MILAAVVTPTPDFFNLMLFAVPMCLLYFVGVFASYLLVMKREGQRFPWGKVLLVLLAVLLVFGGLTVWAMLKMHYHLVGHWPFFVK